MTPTPPDPVAEPRLPLRGRLLLAGLGGLAVALGGAGFAYASGADGDSDGDSAWVTVVEDDCPEESAEGDL